MLTPNDFSNLDDEVNFDFKGFLIKMASYWKWFLISLMLSFTIAYQINIRKEKIYGIETLIAVREENNPLFTSNTSLVFNWGGISDQVQSISTTLKSRSHNELVVDKLNYYIDYLVQGNYNLIDGYGAVPFIVNIDTSKPQLLDVLIGVKFLNATEYEINIKLDDTPISIITYTTNNISTIVAPFKDFSKKYKIGQQVLLPFLEWNLQINNPSSSYIGKEYFVRFNKFDSTVSTYREINVISDTKGGSIITLGLMGTNKARMVMYLNATVEMLIKKQLESKNQFATNTIAFIDSTLIAMESQLKATGNELKAFRKGKNIYNVSDGGAKFSENILEYDVKKEELNRKLSYYNSLRSYLFNSTNYAKLPAPSVAGIEDPNIVANVSKLIALSTQRSEMAYAVKSEKIFNDFDNQIKALKNVLLENIITAKVSVENDVALIKNKINTSENIIKQLPQDQQELIKIKRKYDLSDNIYNTFLQKRSEADIVKAANLSDIHFIDPAKDVGEGLLGPRTSINYLIAFFIGILIPLLILIVLFFSNNTVQNTDDVSRLTSIPVIGIIGVNKQEGNLAVFNQTKSALSESFRAIRSSLQFLYKQQHLGGGKTVMITSSVSAEGKTFCAVNIATVFALSEKRTILIGLDLRKPNLAAEFSITNDAGVVNYLIAQKTVDEIINHTAVPYLDVILSGPIPPNPAEMMINERLGELINELKKNYDYIVLDTPPIGLVSDALEIAQYCDVTLYIVRQNFTKKGMISLINNRVKRGELKNISIILNALENKAKYGANYGYSSYSDGYLKTQKPNNFFKRIFNFKKKYSG